MDQVYGILKGQGMISTFTRPDPYGWADLCIDIVSGLGTMINGTSVKNEYQTWYRHNLNISNNQFSIFFIFDIFKKYVFRETRTKSNVFKGSSY